MLLIMGDWRGSAGIAPSLEVTYAVTVLSGLVCAGRV